MVKNFCKMTSFCSVVCYLGCFSSIKTLCDSNHEKVSAPETIYYKNNDNLRMQLHFNGIPSNAEYYIVYMKSVDRPAETVSLKREHVSRDIVFEKLLAQYFQDQEMYTQVLTRKETQICEYKLPFKLRLSSNSKVSSHKCLSGDFCKYTVDIKCNKEQLALPKNGTLRELNHRVFKLRNNKFSDEQPDILYKSVGEVVTFYCDFEGNNSNIYLNWTQLDKDNGERISTVIGNTGSRNLSVQMEILLFDNNTNWVCNAYKFKRINTTYDTLVARSKVTNIMCELKNDHTNYSLGEDQRVVHVNDNKTPSCYNRDILLSCETNLNFKYWWETKRDKPFKHHKDNFKFQMDDEHMDAQFICLGYEFSYSDGLYTRKLQLKQTYYLDKEVNCEAVLPLSTSTSSPNNLPVNTPHQKQAGGSTEILMYGLVAGAVLLVGLLAAFYCRMNRKRPNSQQVVTYTTARVQYADLNDLPSTGSRTRTIQRDDSPYAEIIGFMEPVNK